MKRHRPNMFVITSALACLVATAYITFEVLSKAKPKSEAATVLAMEDGAPELSPIAEAPAFKLTDQDGEPFDSASLAGKVWIADFIFTRCQIVCPVLSREMGLVRDAINQTPHGKDVQLISISVDPEHDTPEVLKAYSAKFGADGSQWRFLTGQDKQQVWGLVELGFKLALDEAPQNPAMPIEHSSKMVLIDRQGQIRGYFDGMSPGGRESLLAAVAVVTAEKASE